MKGVALNTQCPSCQSRLSFSREAVGKAGRCNSCGAVLRIGRSGLVSLAERQARARPASGGSMESEPFARSGSRSVSRWIDWVIAGAISLAPGVVIGFVAGRMSLSGSGSNRREQLGEAEAALRQDVEAQRDTIEGLQRRLRTEEGQAQTAKRQASTLLLQSESLRGKINESTIALRDLGTKLSEAEIEGDSWKFRATALLENEKVLKSQLALFKESQTALQELLKHLQVGSQRQAELQKTEDRLAALAKQIQEAERQAEIFRRKIDAARKRAPRVPQKPTVIDTGGKVYAGAGGGHWVKKNVDSGTYIVLEDGSLWKIDPFDKIDAMLWLPISSITVTKSSGGSPSYDYLLINTGDGEKAHAKYMGKQ